MARGGWREFRTPDGAVRFDVLENRYIRTRYKPGDQGKRRAYIVIDILTMRAVMIELYEGGELVLQMEPREMAWRR